MKNKKTLCTAILLALALMLSACQNSPAASGSSVPASSQPASSSSSSKPRESSEPQPEDSRVYNQDYSLSIPITAEIPQAVTKTVEHVELRQEDYGDPGGWYEAAYTAKVELADSFALPETVKVFQYIPNESTQNVVHIFNELFPDLVLLDSTDDLLLSFYGSCAENYRSYTFDTNGSDYIPDLQFNLANGYFFASPIIPQFTTAFQPGQSYSFDPKALAEIACQAAMKFHGVTGDIVLSEYTEEPYSFNYEFIDGKSYYDNLAIASFTFTPAAKRPDDGLERVDTMTIRMTPDGQIYSMDNQITTAKIKEVLQVPIEEQRFSLNELFSYFEYCASKENDVVTLISAVPCSFDSLEVDIFRPTVEITYRIESTGEEQKMPIAANEYDTFNFFGGNLGIMG